MDTEETEAENAHWKSRWEELTAYCSLPMYYSYIISYVYLCVCVCVCVCVCACARAQNSAQNSERSL